MPWDTTSQWHAVAIVTCSVLFPFVFIKSSDQKSLKWLLLSHVKLQGFVSHTTNLDVFVSASTLEHSSRIFGGLGEGFHPDCFCSFFLFYRSYPVAYHQRPHQYWPVPILCHLSYNEIRINIVSNVFLGDPCISFPHIYWDYLLDRCAVLGDLACLFILFSLLKTMHIIPYTIPHLK